MNYVVITNTYNRPLDLVERSLRASLSQEINPQKVILIDQNSNPLKLSKDIKNNPLLEVQTVNAKCVSVARNKAQYPKDIEWLCFCDDDGYMDENYSEVLQKTIQNDSNIEIIAGSIIRDDTFGYYSPRHAIGGDINKFRNTKLLMGSNFAVRRLTFEGLGKFDEMFGTGSYWGSGEESDFAWKAYFNNTPMIYKKELRVLHVRPYASETKEAIQKAYNYGIGKGALVAKWIFSNKKFTVFYELTEMTIVPFIKMIKSILKLDKKEVFTSIYSLLGRYKGIYKYLVKP